MNAGGGVNVGGECAIGAGGRASGVGVVLALGVVWVAAVCCGLAVLVDYATTPTDGDDPARHWPERSRLPPPAGRPVLVMFAHPRCACTRASLGELALIMTRCRHSVTTHVLFLRPEGAAADWWKTDLWDSAGSIPGVSVATDEQGAEAKLFGATVSGETLLYDREGRLIFNGGITGARGHFGDNDGRRAVVDLIEGRSAPRAAGLVFGCALRNPRPEAGMAGVP